MLTAMMSFSKQPNSSRMKQQKMALMEKTLVLLLTTRLLQQGGPTTTTTTLRKVLLMKIMRKIKLIFNGYFLKSSKVSLHELPYTAADLVTLLAWTAMIIRLRSHRKSAKNDSRRRPRLHSQSGSLRIRSTLQRCSLIRSRATRVRYHRQTFNKSQAWSPIHRLSYCRPKTTTGPTSSHLAARKTK